MKIDSQTVVPLGWVFSGFVLIVVSVTSASFWVSSVNDRLGRIEQKLGITPYPMAAGVAPDLFEAAKAATK